MSVNQWQSVNSWGVVATPPTGGEIPLLDRSTINKLSSYVTEQGFDVGSSNDNINAWLESEGVSGGTYNDRFNAYLEQQGYTDKTYQDKHRKWIKG